MNPILHIRKRLGLSQAAFGAAIGCKQANVSHYELGQPFPTERAKRLIRYAAQQGIVLTFDNIYGGAQLPDVAATTAEA